MTRGWSFKPRRGRAQRRLSRWKDERRSKASVGRLPPITALEIAESSIDFPDTTRTGTLDWVRRVYDASHTTAYRGAVTHKLL